MEKLKVNLGQNPDNLKHFLMKDFQYDCEKDMKLIDKAIVANIIKSVIFNGKVAFRITRADSNADDLIIVPETQEDNSHVVHNDVIEDWNCCTETGVIEDSQTRPNDQQISNILIITENSCSLLDAVEKWFMKIEAHMIRLSKPIGETSKLKKQLAMKTL